MANNTANRHTDMLIAVLYPIPRSE